MRKLAFLLPVLALALLVAACDTTEELDESEVFIGSWAVVNLTDEEGDKTAVFQQGVEAFTATLLENKSFSLAVDYREVAQRPDQTFTGSYTVDEGANFLTLNVQQPIQAALGFQYEIETEDRVKLTISDQLIEGIFQTDPSTYAGQVTLTIQRR